jgi:hypothetical protein
LSLANYFKEEKKKEKKTGMKGTQMERKGR